MAEDKPRDIRDPSAAGQAGGLSDGSSPASGKTSVHPPGHKHREPSGVKRGPISKDPRKESEADLAEADTPPGPLTPGNRA